MGGTMDSERACIENIEHRGMLIDECSLSGETKSDSVVPAHPNGTRISKNRWLLVYATRSFRGNDDDRSVVYQLRGGSPDGEIIKEGILAKSIDDWKTTWKGKEHTVKREHRSPVVFGVPKGAHIGGKPAQNENVFVTKWSTVAREIDRETNIVEGTNLDPAMLKRTQRIEWAQIQLNDTEDDIEFLSQPEEFRQKGFENEQVFCSAPDVSTMNQGKKQAIPYTEDCREWVDTSGFDGQRFSAIKYRFDEVAGLYEWVETGPFLFDPKEKYVHEAQIARYGDYWIAAARTDYVKNHVRLGRGLAWTRLEDPFVEPRAVVYPKYPQAAAPVSLFLCPDGILRYFAGEGPSSPYQNERDPLYCWDIDPEKGFACTNRRIIFDTVKAGLPIRREAAPMADMCKLLPHDGRTQYLLHRVNLVSRFTEHIHTEPVRWVFPPVNEAEIRACGIYYAVITYEEGFPSPWGFPGE